ncbi:hypothetical protein PHLCEN_2v10584 [Hermanssonia centrifuga]|uniref:Uncharacterized protein n=1 Tax=Hermanssonia centrifuga TaxID=98765 RepID=A0A2R6NMT2_9APHY|nr:hypothetical protein PHLCEN_2v10584 [Hermanssonia centrifuga]
MDGLFIPYDIFALATSSIFWAGCLHVCLLPFVCLGDREDQDKSIGGTRNVSEKIWLIEREDIGEYQFRGDPEVVD